MSGSLLIALLVRRTDRSRVGSSNRRCILASKSTYRSWSIRWVGCFRVSGIAPFEYGRVQAGGSEKGRNRSNLGHPSIAR